MPREQRSRLAKGPVTEVTPGEFGSGVVETQQMPMAKPVKTAGQALAESVGMMAKGGLSILEHKRKEEETQEMIQWSRRGESEGRRVFEAAAKLPLDEREEYLENELEAFNKSFEAISEGRGVSAAGFRAGLGAFSQYVGNAEDAAMKQRMKTRAKEGIEGTNIYINTDIQNNLSPEEIMKKIWDDNTNFPDKASK